MAVAHANSLDGLRERLAAATDERYRNAISARIAEIERRLQELPQSLPLEVREEIVELEGQVRIHSAYTDTSKREIDAMKAEIAKLMEGTAS